MIYMLPDRRIVMPFSTLYTSFPHTVSSFQPQMLSLPYLPHQALSARYEFHLSLWNCNYFFCCCWFSVIQQIQLSPKPRIICPFWRPFSSHSMSWLSDKVLYSQNILAGFYLFVQQVCLTDFSKLTASFYSVEILENFTCFFFHESNKLNT